jgi:hypothetical protein
VQGSAHEAAAKAGAELADVTRAIGFFQKNQSTTQRLLAQIAETTKTLFFSFYLKHNVH